RQEILYGEIDLARARAARWQLDVTGHYARPDIFELRLDRRARPALGDVQLAATESELPLSVRLPGSEGPPV
ncbi:MAG TPA: hypothetical protein VF832_16380, partial [Longimicrobiales bacterium]